MQIYSFGTAKKPFYKQLFNISFLIFNQLFTVNKFLILYELFNKTILFL